MIETGTGVRKYPDCVQCGKVLTNATCYMINLV